MNGDFARTIKEMARHGAGSDAFAQAMAALERAEEALRDIPPIGYNDGLDERLEAFHYFRAVTRTIEEMADPSLEPWQVEPRPAPQAGSILSVVADAMNETLKLIPKLIDPDELRMFAARATGLSAECLPPDALLKISIDDLMTIRGERTCQ